MNFEIVVASTPDQIEVSRELFREYEKWLGLSLCFQGFEEELASLPGRYGAENGGRLWLAYIGDEAVGCIALRRLDDGACEMKRLYLRESARGRKIGVALIETLIAAAAEIGYDRIRLDTYPPRMAKAVSLYESYGFREIEPYYHNPFGETLFMEKMI